MNNNNIRCHYYLCCIQSEHFDPVESPVFFVLTLSKNSAKSPVVPQELTMAEEPVKYFTLKLNYLQFETVRNLFIHSGWDFEDCVIGPNKSFETNVTNDTLQENEISEPTNHQMSDGHDGSGDGGDDDGGDDDGGDDDGDNSGDDMGQDGECGHCFLSPCVTENRQLWLAQQPLAPPVRNSGLRKRKYKNFWTMMDRRGAWKLEKYLQKKSRLLGSDSYVWTLREVMPSYIVNLVRSLYPNPHGQPYMGHKWA